MTPKNAGLHSLILSRLSRPSPTGARQFRLQFALSVGIFTNTQAFALRVLGTSDQTRSSFHVFSICFKILSLREGQCFSCLELQKFISAIMTRVLRRAASAYATRAPSRLARLKHRKHRVIMESVTQEKKKLRSVVRCATNSY